MAIAVEGVKKDSKGSIYVESSKAFHPKKNSLSREGDEKQEKDESKSAPFFYAYFEGGRPKKTKSNKRNGISMKKLKSSSKQGCR